MLNESDSKNNSIKYDVIETVGCLTTKKKTLIKKFWWKEILVNSNNKKEIQTVLIATGVSLLFCNEMQVMIVKLARRNKDKKIRIFHYKEWKKKITSKDQTKVNKKKLKEKRQNAHVIIMNFPRTLFSFNLAKLVE